MVIIIRTNVKNNEVYKNRKKYLQLFAHNMNIKTIGCFIKKKAALLRQPLKTYMKIHYFLINSSNLLILDSSSMFSAFCSSIIFCCSFIASTSIGIIPV